MRSRLASLIAVAALVATPASTQTYSPPKLGEFGTALDRANSATNDSNVSANLPGYGGDAPAIQNRAGDDVSTLQSEGALLSATSPVKPALTGANAYKVANPVDENAAWVKGALGVANDPKAVGGGVRGTTLNVCSTAIRGIGLKSIYSCESGNSIVSNDQSCEIYRDIVSVPAARTCKTNSYYENFKTSYADIGLYTHAHRCTVFAGPGGLNTSLGCGYLIARIPTGDCAPPLNIAGNEYLQFCKMAKIGISSIAYLGERALSCEALAADTTCTKTSERCDGVDSPTVCNNRTDTYICGAGGYEDRGINGGGCAGYVANAACTMTGETCTATASSAPDIMAALGLAADTCLRWSKSFACDSVASTGSNCEVPAGCVLQAQTCIDPGYDGTAPCKTYDYTYVCEQSVPTADAGAICDASWVSGTAIITGADDPDNDLPQALSAINALKDAGKSYSSSGDLTIFGGKSLKCGKSIGGLSNCCKDSGLLLDISLTSCNAEEKELAAQQKKKACHFVGTYCSNKSFFGCLIKKMTYCCYGSVLARIVEEAGHEQLAKPWGDAKSPQCGGFTIEEFQRIDLTNVDFSDFYADKLSSLAREDPDSTVAAIAASIDTMNASKSSVK